jgi:hypothetical protein
MADLLHLIRFRLVTPGLQVQNLVHSIAGEDVVTPSNPLAEPKALQHTPQIIEENIGVRGSAQNLFKGLIRRQPSLLLQPMRPTITAMQWANL